MATTFTPRGYPLIDLDEPPNGPAQMDAISERADAEDVTAATLGALPAADPALIGRHGFVSGTGRTYRDTGAAWLLQGSVNLVEHANPAFTGVMTFDADANLYRTAAAILKTDGSLKTGADLIARDGAASQVKVGTVLSNAGVSLGLAGDANLYRSAANAITTPGSLAATGGFLIGAPLTSVPAYQAQQVAGQTVLRNKLLSADANDAFHILGDGKMEWGAGGASAPDTVLQRSGADTLLTADRIVSNRGLATDIAFNTWQNSQHGLQILASGKMQWADGLGGAVDTFLDRPQANVLRTTGYHFVTNYIDANTGTANRVILGHNGTAIAASLAFGSALDTNLYRAAADVLKTDDAFRAATVSAQQGTANDITLFSDGHIYFGSTGDTNLYRSALDTLKTDDNFIAAQTLTANVVVANNTSTINNSLNSARMALGWDGAAQAAAIAFTDGATGYDTNIYRSAANLLKTDDSFHVALDFRHLGTNLGFYGAAAVAKAGATNDLKASLVSLGLVTGGGATPLNLNSGALTAASATLGGLLTAGDVTASALTANSMVRSQGTGQGSASSGGGAELQYSGGVGDVQARDTGTGFFQTMRVSGSSVTLRSNTTDRIKVDTTGVGFFGNTPVARPGTYTSQTGTFSRNLPSAATLPETVACLRQLLSDFSQVGGLGLIAVS